MLRALTLLRRTIYRFVGWKGVGVAISIIILLLAFIALARAFNKIDFDQVLAAMLSTSMSRIATAVTLITASYCSLTLYDLFALRMIGRRDIPYPVIVLASATSYPIAHGVGAVLPISTAIRYRVYSTHGLGAADVAKVCFLTGLTFWLGNLTALGLSILYQPDAVSLLDYASGEVNRLLAVALLAAISGYLYWTWGSARKIGRRNWSVNLPAGRIALLQIGIGIFDLGCAALAMYQLIPAEMNMALPRVIAVFITATLLGFLSHAPAGLGVFDAAILVGLGFAGEEQLVAALLLFRLFYHFLPFVLALTAFTAREGRRGLARRRT